MKKSHAEDTVGPWAKQKLDALESYLIAYTQVMKKQPFKLVFIDAFAGSGIAKIRSSATDQPMDPLLDEEDARDEEQFILGSPLRALRLPIPFNVYRFIDMDPRRVKLLEDMKTEFPKLDVAAKVGDANEDVQRIARNFTSWNLRGVAFLDPYGAHLHWATLEALANTGKFDVIINFPLDMAINRLLKRNGDIPASWAGQLDRCFGCSDWRDLAYERRTDLFQTEFSEKHPQTTARLLDLYTRRLREAFGHVSEPSLVRNTKGAPLYYLIWAGGHARGKPIADHILRLGDRVKVPVKRSQKRPG